MAKEIHSSDWAAFCQRISRQRAGAMVKLEVAGPDGFKTERAANATLQSMTFDKTDACSDVITLRLRDTHEIIHEIIEPIQIGLHSSGTADDFNLLHIKAESGVTFMTFHPTIHPQMLEGLKTS
jgi:hypothetical protein